MLLININIWDKVCIFNCINFTTLLAKAAYNSAAAYDTRQNTYPPQQTYQTQPQYAPYQVSSRE